MPRSDRRREEQVHDIGTQTGAANGLIVTAKESLERGQQRETEEHPSRGLVTDTGRDE